MRVDHARARFGQHVESAYGVTGAQLALLRIIEEIRSTTLAALRERLVLHPATLGQLIDRLARRGLVELAADPEDRRRRLVRLTDGGREVCPSGRWRDRSDFGARRPTPTGSAASPPRWMDALDLFGWKEWAP